MRTITNKPNILDVLQAEGVELRQRGKHFWTCCPLHSEKTPSFAVNPEKGRFRCYGCGVSGDAIDFTMRLKAISFPETLKYLGISGDSWRPVTLTVQERRKLELVRKFRRWEQLMRRALSELVRLSNKIDLLLRPEDLEKPGIGEMYIKKFIYEYYLDILSGYDDELKLGLYRSYYGNKRICA